MQKKFDKELKKAMGMSDAESISSPSPLRVLLAVSGGIDSMCMADLFLHSSVGVQFAVAHCNFHLRGEESDGDEASVAKWAADKGVKLYKTDFDTDAYASRKGISIEMAARELRYDWFARICRSDGFNFLAVAHNSNDNAETLILNLLRGAGARGISGMSMSSPMPSVSVPHDGIRLIRPLLGFTRKQIEGYSFARRIAYRNDSTNEMCEYKRNKIRNKVFPVFYEINPSFVDTLNRDMRYFSQVEIIAKRYFDSVKNLLLQPAGNGAVCRIDLAQLASHEQWEYLLYKLLEPYGFNSSIVASLVRLIEEVGTVSGKIFYSRSGYEVFTSSSELIVRPSSPRKHGDFSDVSVVPDVSDVSDVPVVQSKQLRGKSPLKSTSITEPVMVVRAPGVYHFNNVSFEVKTMPRTSDFILRQHRGTIVFDADKLAFPFVCRRWRHGDWMIPLGMSGKKKISDMFTDLKYDLSMKESAIMLISGSLHKEPCDIQRVAALLGERIDNTVKVSDSTKTLTIIKII